MPLVCQALDKGTATRIGTMDFYSESKEEGEHKHLCDRGPRSVRKKPGELYEIMDSAILQLTLPVKGETPKTNDTE